MSRKMSDAVSAMDLESSSASYPIVFIEIMCKHAKYLRSLLVVKQIGIIQFSFMCLIFLLKYSNNPVLTVH